MTTNARYTELLEAIENSLENGGGGTDAFWIALGTAICQAGSDVANEIEPPSPTVLMAAGDLEQEALVSSALDARRARAALFQLAGTAGEDPPVGTLQLLGSEDADAVAADILSGDYGDIDQETAKWAPVKISSLSYPVNYDADDTLLYSWDAGTQSDLNLLCSVDNPPAFMRWSWGGASGGEDQTLRILGRALV